jgi:hypothetical protein
MVWNPITNGITDNGTIKSFVVNMADSPRQLFRLERPL